MGMILEEDRLDFAIRASGETEGVRAIRANIDELVQLITYAVRADRRQNREVEHVNLVVPEDHFRAASGDEAAELCLLACLQTVQPETWATRLTRDDDGQLIALAWFDPPLR